MAVLTLLIREMPLLLVPQKMPMHYLLSVNIYCSILPAAAVKCSEQALAAIKSSASRIALHIAEMRNRLVWRSILVPASGVLFDKLKWRRTIFRHRYASLPGEGILWAYMRPVQLFYHRRSGIKFGFE